MLAGQFLKQRAHGTSLAALRLFQSPANTADRLKELLVIQEALICLRTLDYDFGLSVDCQHRRLAGALELAKVPFGVPLKVA